MNNHGSEWHRWDLHLHTPFTKKNDKYEGRTEEEKWDKFYESIEQYIGDGKDPLRNVIAIGITDYLSIDNYQKVIQDNRLPKSVKLVLPNVELRLELKANNSPINIHCVFSNKIAEELEVRFFQKLIKTLDRDYNATKRDLISMGKKNSNNMILNDDKYYQKGLEQFAVSLDALKAVFKDKELRENTIIIVPNGCGDGATGLVGHNNGQLELTRQDLYYFVDAIFSSNEKDIQYFLGEKADTVEQLRNKIGSLKPCIHGCDAHTNSKIFTPDNDKFCWIKAEPTFEGLKQILYEPKDRVRISSTIPDSKPDYQIIDRIEINDKDFQEEPIFFNDKLTCIIGGKSTGKSLLLNNLAKKIDPKEFDSKVNNLNIKPIQSLKVYWRDNLEEECKDNRKIVFIPQSFLNNQVDKENGLYFFDKIAKELISKIPECSEIFNELNKNVRDKQISITNSVENLFFIINDRNKITEDIQNIGIKKLIENEIVNLQLEALKLSETKQINQDEVNQYNNLSKQIIDLQEKNTKLEEELKTIRSIDYIFSNKFINRFSEDFNLILLKPKINEIIENIASIANEKWHLQKQILIQETEKIISNNKYLLQKQIITRNDIEPKIKQSEQMKKITELIAIEQTKLNKLNELENNKKQLIRKYNDILTTLSKCFEEFQLLFSVFKAKINELLENNFNNDIKFSINFIFDINSLKEKLLEILNNKSLSKFKHINIQGEIKESDFTYQKLEKLISSIIDNNKDSLQVKSNYDPQSALSVLLRNWYRINFDVTMENDSIRVMSPGKRALVLLKLLISLSDNECPILIDQPEDDLDNRSIYEELVKFIKEKKIKRQIILVTHNANIVLGSDAELVVVANQDGENSKNNKYRFEYRCGAIEDNKPVYEKEKIKNGVLYEKGIQDHICEILEGGKTAFELRKHKYNI